MNNTTSFNRRLFLRGLGVGITLPALEPLLPSKAFAAGETAATTATGAPLRMGFVYVPNGVILDKWRPVGEGDGFELNKTMEPLAEFKDSMQIFTGFEHKNGWSGPDGAGDHARANATILTGARPKKTAGADVRVGVSVDQFAAQHVGQQTRFSSLELSCDGVRKAGVCDSGYSCAYQFNLSWRTETSPVAPESNPRLVFERLFGSGKGAERQQSFQLRQARQKSILDFVMEDAKSMHRELGYNDQQKMDEYLTGVRDIETRIQKAEKFGPPPEPGVDAPSGIPTSYQDHIRLMADMLVLAYQTDSTRVSTFLMAHDGSNRSFKELGVPEGHHYLSHHQNDAQKMDRISKIDFFYTQQLAYFLKRLRETKDVDGKTLLDNSMIVYCSGLSDGNRHRHDDLPVIVAGGGGGRLTPGRHVKLGSNTPMTNLYVSLLNNMGVKTERFADSTGALGNV
ncbi:MAG TPA: DUF1552 domain-containing protein [Roseimicrobium sp.]|nr:DUF1552 domain-containing protein [Roseimicrobium sp.]